MVTRQSQQASARISSYGCVRVTVISFSQREAGEPTIPFLEAAALSNSDTVLSVSNIL
jgi:hypothetical protein